MMEKVQSKQGKELVLQELIPQTLGGNTPFLANQTKVDFLELRLNGVEATLHFPTIGEQRQNGASQCQMHPSKEGLQSRKVGNVIGLRNVCGHIHRHIVVEVKA